MTLGVVMLVHTEFGRAEEAVRHWAGGDCPVVIHVDRRVDAATFADFATRLADLPDVIFSDRFRCEWGTWGLVKAAQTGSELLLRRFAAVDRVYLASGSCLPLRPVSELRAYLDARPGIDFIESALTSDVPWTVGGLDAERFVLRFPFSWKKQRWLFDRYVKLQQMLGLRRKIPDGLAPHLGSQWWCLTRQTLEAIFNDPNRGLYDRYFKDVWIPDESYFQTMVRHHSDRIESRSLTLSKFDYLGKPHIFYDDHLELLARSRCFVARKIWPKADLLHRTFPRATPQDRALEEPNTTTIDKIFDNAVTRRIRGRHGLYMQSRFPSMDRENGSTARSYSVLHGFEDIIPGFADWLKMQTGAEVHGHVFGRDKAHFSAKSDVFRGGLSNNAQLRNYNPEMFLANLIWGARDTYQCFQFGPQDAQKICWMMAKDTNARISVVSGAWAVPLFLSGVPAADCRAKAARLQARENAFLQILRSPYAKAQTRIVSLSAFVAAPRDILQHLVDEIAGHNANDLRMIPQMADLDGFGAFLQSLKNQGMPPYLAGEFSTDPDARNPAPRRQRPYLRAEK